jgi:hypothetical protein
MSAKVHYCDNFSKVFCILVPWLEQAWREEVMILEADDENGHLVLYGEPNRCREFQAEIQKIIVEAEATEEYWRI